MELMDWKKIEGEAEQQILSGEGMIAIGKVVLKKAVTEIKKLGGQTNAETDKEARESRAGDDSTFSVR